MTCKHTTTPRPLLNAPTPTATLPHYITQAHLILNLLLQSTQNPPLFAIVAFNASLANKNFGKLDPPQESPAIQTFLVQQEPTAHTLPSAQSALVLQSGRPEQGVSPLTQKPVLSDVEAQTQEPPAPHALKFSQVPRLVQPVVAQTPLVQVPVEHWNKSDLGFSNEGVWSVEVDK